MLGKGDLLLICPRVVGDDEGTAFSLLGCWLLGHRVKHESDPYPVRFENLVALPCRDLVCCLNKLMQVARALLPLLNDVIELSLQSVNSAVRTHLEGRHRLVFHVVPPAILWQQLTIEHALLDSNNLLSIGHSNMLDGTLGVRRLCELVANVV